MISEINVPQTLHGIARTLHLNNPLVAMSKKALQKRSKYWQHVAEEVCRRDFDTTKLLYKTRRKLRAVRKAQRDLQQAYLRNDRLLRKLRGDLEIERMRTEDLRDRLDTAMAEADYYADAHQYRYKDNAEKVTNAQN